MATDFDQFSWDDNEPPPQPLNEPSPDLPDSYAECATESTFTQNHSQPGGVEAGSLVEGRSDPSGQIDQKLKRLIREVCQLPQDSRDRIRLREEFIATLQQSGQVSVLENDNYVTAYRETLFWAGDHLCDFDRYQQENSASATVIQWFNDHLKALLEDFRGWLETKRSQLREDHFCNCPEANCYDLTILSLPQWDEGTQRFIEGQTWEQIAQTLSVPFAESPEELLQETKNYYEFECCHCFSEFLNSSRITHN